MNQRKIARVGSMTGLGVYTVIFTYPWTKPASTTGGTAYAVFPELWTCSCPAWTRHMRVCCTLCRQPVKMQIGLICPTHGPRADNEVLRMRCDCKHIQKVQTATKELMKYPRLRVLILDAIRLIRGDTPVTLVGSDVGWLPGGLDWLLERVRMERPATSEVVSPQERPSGERQGTRFKHYPK